MRCGENPVHERMNSIAENKGEIKTIFQAWIAVCNHQLEGIVKTVIDIPIDDQLEGYAWQR